MITKKYHLRRQEKAITDEHELFDIISHQKFFTIAMCNDKQPYLVSMNYAFDKENKCFYFHCAQEGKKIDYLLANPKVWGQIVEDKGYLQGECEQIFRSIHFKGSVEFLRDVEKKRDALKFLLEQLEDNPEIIQKKYINENSLLNVNIGKISVVEITGKNYKKN
jgi:nitroimidazol reductase NimA-like FMN-containing flavoprotein (pyridoxamine 5'-phosphate oxidase superfamily)